MLATVSRSRLVQVAIAAFIGAVLPPLEKVAESGSLPNLSATKIIVFAGIAAALRAVILFVPSNRA